MSSDIVKNIENSIPIRKDIKHIISGIFAFFIALIMRVPSNIYKTSIDNSMRFL